MSESWRLPAHASLFGKLPTVLDYVRINHSYPAAIALDEWMSRALSDLTVASLSWPSARFRFLFAPSGCEHALLGVFGPSKDRAGRKFPLSIFAPVPVAAIARRFAALPRAQDFFAAAEALLDEASGLSREAAGERLAALPTLAPATLDVLHDELQVALDERSHASVVQELYGGLEHDAEDAFARAASSFAKHRSAAPDRALTLDCPVSITDDVCAWTSLAEVCLGWSLEAPSLFWTSPPATRADEGTADPGRLLICLGTPLSMLPVWLADKKRKNERLISLRASATASAPGYASSSPPPAAPVWTPPPEVPAPTASASTPARAPLPARGGSTPPQGFAITHPQDAHFAVPAPQPREDSFADVDVDSDALADIKVGLGRRGPAPLGGSVEAPTDHPSAELGGEAGDSPAFEESRESAPTMDASSEPASVPTQAQPRGMSLWRKLRALAASG